MCYDNSWEHDMSVTVYATHSCQYCKLEKSYLDENSIDYEVIFADDTRDNALKLYEESGQLGVPFTIIESADGKKHKVLGFDKARLAKLLGLE
ncbi:glutaredoxin family protein [candidate division WWE3 bacterium]|uniref:Glutaredoxin family protein n=1 Tax=candidate division WWE3 bacterium TaxID=2053526 RepID=A0A955LLD0_UNCKA|nr:glutaredoxin family protein [candidate division WWE3 bacterium]